jgi:NitT/TauT family transport system permease protein
MKKHQHVNYLAPTYVGIGLVLVFFCWWLYSFILVKQGNSANLWPNPGMVLSAFFANFAEAKVWVGFGWTLLRLLVGFVVSFVLAALFGVLATLWAPLRLILKPFVLILKTVPTAAVVFMLVLLVGNSWTPCYLVFLVVFPIVYESFLQGFDMISKDVKDAMRLDMDPSDPRALFGISLPMASPYILLSVVTSLGLAMKVSIMSEIVAGGNSLNGLGRLIYVANSIDGDMTQVMALSLIAILTIALADLLLALLKRKLKPEDIVDY